MYLKGDLGLLFLFKGSLLRLFWRKYILVLIMIRADSLARFGFAPFSLGEGLGMRLFFTKKDIPLPGCLSNLNEHEKTYFKVVS